MRYSGFWLAVFVILVLAALVVITIAAYQLGWVK
jgi:hypothetical protein